MWRLLLLALVSVALAGCSTISSVFEGKDNLEPPRELESLVDSLTTRTLWTADAGSGAGDQDFRLVPAFAGGRVYTADRKGGVFAFDADSGERLWASDTDSPIAGGVGAGAGLVLVGTSGGEVIALDATDGSERWRARVTSEVLAPPQAADGVVVVRCVDGFLLGLDADTGRQLWTFNRQVPALTLRGTSAPVIAHGRVVSGFDNGKLTVLTLREGVPLWERAVAVSRGRSELERMVDIDADPRLYGGTVYVVAYQGRVGAVDLANGSVQWAFELSSAAGMDVGPRYVMVTDENSELWAIDRATGRPLWKQDGLRGRAVTGPAILGDHALVGDFEGYLHWLSLDTGKFVARERLDSSGINAPPLVVDGVAYVLGRSGKLTAISL